MKLSPTRGDLSRLTLNTEYRSVKEEPVHSFYQPCLAESDIYKRAVGYFRSTVYLVIGPAMLEFAKRGGKTNLICSPDLSPKDIDSIETGYRRRDQVIAERLISEIDYLLADPKTTSQTQVLATLISTGALDIKVAVNAQGNGIYHEKIGIFCDSIGNRVSFKGSTNETWNGWHQNGNFESIEVFCSWRRGLEGERVQNHEQHFDDLWSEKDQHVDVFAFPQEAMKHLRKLSGDETKIMSSIPPPEESSPKRTPMRHQTEALQAWEALGCRGILEHATGSGKTFTAILALKEHISKGKPAIVLVPSRLLLEQWEEELRDELPNAALLIAGGGNTSWKSANRLKSMTQNDDALGGRIVLAIMKTAASDRFRSNVIESDSLMVVADEVHQIGSSYHSRFLSILAGSRLGLSATPKRYGDPEGTEKLLAYFGGVIQPPFTLVDAIKCGRLVEYEYFPHALNLTATEAESWKKLSIDIRNEMARQKEDEGGQKKLTERAKMLLIKRSRIAKKATKKIDLARQIIKSQFESGQHWLIYCEDSEQLSEVHEALKEDGFSPIVYHSKMTADRHATLDWFKTFGGLLVSIKCLDEGVDIPAVSHALILASSQNPRQFIQRRGRVLRKLDGKHFAEIHDAMVVPISLDDEPEQASLLQSEMLRSIEFAENAVNKLASAELRTIATELGFDDDNLSDVGIEDEEDDD